MATRIIIRNKDGNMNVTIDALENADSIKNAIQNHIKEFGYTSEIVIYVEPFGYEIFYSNQPHKCDIIDKKEK